MQIKQSKILLTLVIIMAFPFLTMIFGINTAKADLFIYPLRVVFEGRDRSAEISLINQTNEAKTYRMEWKLLRMTSKESYETIEDDDKSDFAERARKVPGLIRFSPRQVVLEPGAKQKIRLSLRRNAEMEDGEYRAHLSFSRLPDAPKPSSGEDVASGKASFSIGVKMSFSIPIIIRSGGDVSSSIDGISFNSAEEDPQKKFSMNIELSRKGTNTSYGEVMAYFTPAKSGKEKKIGLLSNVSVYPELDKRVIRMPLDVDYLEKGSVRVIFQGDKEYAGTIWDEKVFPIVN